MALLATLTSMDIAEIRGLQWKRVDLNGWRCDPAYDVRRQWYRGALTSLKKKARVRDLPIPAGLIPVLKELRSRGKFTDPDDYAMHRADELGGRNMRAIRVRLPRRAQRKP